MNWIDLLILLLLLSFAWEGRRRGLFHELFDFFSFFIAFLLSLRFYQQAASVVDSFANNFAIPHSLANVLGFIGVWFLTESVLISLYPLIYSQARLIPQFSWLEKLVSPLGMIPALLRGLIFVSILLVLVGTFPIQPQIKNAVDKSKLGSFILAKTAEIESPLKNIFGGISQDTLTFLTIKPQSRESVDLGYNTLNFSPNETLEAQMIDLVNRERTSRNIKALSYSPKLRDVARSHSQDMFTRGYFSHFTPEGESVVERAQKYNVSYLSLGENLAYAPTLKLAHNGLMKSPGHKANLLSPDFGRVGIGIMNGGTYGIMVTQVFTN